MESELFHIFGQGTQLMLLGMIAAALFFFMAGLREINTRELQGLLYLAVGAFFLVAHFLYLASTDSANFAFWPWLERFLAPSLIFLFVCFGAARVIVTSYRAGMYLLFFGLTLYCYLYIVGSGWPVDVKGLIALAYSGAWIDLGLKTGVS